MDQGSGDTDKRNWRERLGINKNGTSSDLPKIADEFKPAAQRPSVHGAARPAPMAPRMAPRPAPAAARPAAQPAQPAQTLRPAQPAARGSAPSAAVAPPRPAPAQPAQPSPRTPPISADALAAKLKEQRDAAEKLAIQRVASAKQKVDARVEATGKPKYAFADNDSSQQKLQQQPARPPVAPPMPQPGLRPTMAPPSVAPVHAPQSYQPQPYQPSYPPTYPTSFNPQAPAGYRPIDPSTGFAQAPTFQPRAPLQQQMPPQMAPQAPPQQQLPVQQQLHPQQQQPSLRPNFNPTQRPAAPGFQSPGFQPRANNPAQARMPQLPLSPAPVANQGPRLGSISQDDVFEDAPAPRAPRRATANEYQQAYRDELSDNYEQDRPRVLGWILTAVILALLAAFGGWYYLQFNKPAKLATNGQPVAVEAPVTPAKVPAEAAATTAPAEQAGKKLIYDRIEGDHEVPGGPLKSSEQSPNLQGGAAAPPAAGNTGAVPLPLPPPPAANGKQGAIDTSDGKTDVALITPAAEPSSAANSSVATPDPKLAAAAVPAPDGLPMPASSESVGAASATPPTAADAAKPAAADPTLAPVKKDPPKKVVATAPADASTKSLGAKPVVLVPPAAPVAPLSRTLSPASKQVAAAQAPVVVDSAGGLYGDAPLAPAAPVPPKAASISPAVQSAAASSGSQVQLASFASQAEASAEYQRLVAKHGAIISRYAPLIEQTQVAGATRYRLDLGPMANIDTAQNVCATLIAAGERDCQVRR